MMRPIVSGGSSSGSGSKVAKRMKRERERKVFGGGARRRRLKIMLTRDEKGTTERVEGVFAKKKHNKNITAAVARTV